MHIKENVSDLILWSDFCGGQTQSIKIVLMLIYPLKSHPSTRKITMRDPILGHSYLSNDDFGEVEGALKRQQYIYIPDYYFKVMETCRKKILW